MRNNQEIIFEQVGEPETVNEILLSISEKNENRGPTAFDIIAACLHLKRVKDKIYVDGSGTHFLQTKYGFVPVEQINLQLENNHLNKKTAYQSELIEKHRDTESKLMALQKGHDEKLALKHEALSQQSATILRLKDEIETLKRLIETQNVVMSVNSRIDSAAARLGDINFLFHTKKKLIELQSSVNRLQLKTSKQEKELSRVIDLIEGKG